MGSLPMCQKLNSNGFKKKKSKIAQKLRELGHFWLARVRSLWGGRVLVNVHSIITGWAGGVNLGPPPIRLGRAGGVNLDPPPMRLGRAGGVNLDSSPSP